MSDFQIGFMGNEVGYLAAERVMPNGFSLIDVDPDSKPEQSLCRFDGVIDASMRFRFSDDFFLTAPSLKIISTATTGSDHIDRNAAQRAGVVVVTLKEHPEILRELTPAAELTWTLLMALARNLTGAVDHTRQGLWSRELFPGVMLKGKVLGLVGCGRIGSWIARYGTAFGMEVIGYDPYQEKKIIGLESVSKLDVARRSDFISIHVHLNEETTNLIDRKFLQAMKSSAFLVNTSRGALVDENELLRLIKQKKIAGYGSDVLSSEPVIDSDPMITFSKDNPSVVITPHCGGNSPDAVRLVCSHAAEEVVRFLKHYE